MTSSLCSLLKLLSSSDSGLRPLLSSPTGQQFMSCKEAASFLKSYFGGNDGYQQRDGKTCSIQQAYALSSERVSILLILFLFFPQNLCEII